MLLLLIVAALFLPPSDAYFTNSPETHLSASLKVKCESLPYRSIKLDYGCYFAVMKKVLYRKAPAQCSSVLYGAKVTTTASSSIFEQMMIDKSDYHDDIDSTDAKYILCAYEDEYKCDVGSSMLTSGRCLIRAPKKLNYVDAGKYCADLGMEIPAPANNLDNALIRDALVKDPAWVHKSILQRNGFKWRQVNDFTKWSACNRPTNQNPLQDSGSNKGSCSSDAASVIDKTAYWSKSGTENLMEVVCMKNANNAFTNGEKACTYHEAEESTKQRTGGHISIDPDTAAPSTNTCYTTLTTTTRYYVIGKATVETKRGCEVQCDKKSECSGFSFKDSGFTSSCVLLSTPKPTKLCPKETTIYVKKTSGCVERTNITADFGQDPCIDEIVPSAFRGFNTGPICDPDRNKKYILRAIDSEGRRVTLDIENNSQLIRSGNMWEYVYNYYTYTYRKYIVAASCVTAGSEKCPCDKIKHATDIGESPNYPALPDIVNPCNYTGAYFYYGQVKCPHCEKDIHKWWLRNADTTTAIVKCKAGMWMVWRERDTNSWGVTVMSCFHY